VVAAAIFVHRKHVDRMTPASSEGGKRGTQICDEGSALTQDLMVSLLAAQHLFDKRIGNAFAASSHGPTSARSVFDLVLRPPSKTLTTSVAAASWSSRGETLQLPHPEVAD